MKKFVEGAMTKLDMAPSYKIDLDVVEPGSMFEDKKFVKLCLQHHITIKPLDANGPAGGNPRVRFYAKTPNALHDLLKWYEPNDKDMRDFLAQNIKLLWKSNKRPRR